MNLTCEESRTRTLLPATVSMAGVSAAKERSELAGTVNVEQRWWQWFRSRSGRARILNLEVRKITLVTLVDDVVQRRFGGGRMGRDNGGGQWRAEL